MLNIIGLILIALGIIMFAASLIYAKKNNIKNEKKEYKKLLANSKKADKYEPPKPITRMYEKKPMNIFSNRRSKKAEVLDDEEVEQYFQEDDLLEDDYKEDTNILENTSAETDTSQNKVVEIQSNLPDKESTSILEDEEISEEETSILDMGQGDEETALLNEEQSDEISSFLDSATQDNEKVIIFDENQDEKTEFLNEFENDEMTSILDVDQKAEQTTLHDESQNNEVVSEEFIKPAKKISEEESSQVNDENELSELDKKLASLLSDI